MKKISLLLIGLLLLSGCMFKMTPSEKVEEFLNSYIKNDKEIMKELDGLVESTKMTEKQQDRYKEIIKDEYSSIKYEIKKETINKEGTKAKVKVDITVKDLYAPTLEATKELENNPQKFYTDGLYDEAKYMDYTLELLEKSKDKKDYTITINLTKENNKWQIDELDNDTLSKIHGIFAY